MRGREFGGPGQSNMFCSGEVSMVEEIMGSEDER